MRIEFGALRSALQNTQNSPEHIICGLACHLDPSVMGYEFEHGSEFRETMSEYMVSHFERRDLGGTRSVFMTNESSLNDAWNAVVKGADHLRFYNVHGSYAQRHHLQYTLTEYPGPKSSIRFLSDQGRRAGLKLKALELDFGDVDQAFLLAPYQNIIPLMDEGPIHIALGDHSSLTRSNFGSEYKNVGKFIDAATSSGRVIEGVRCDGSGLFESTSGLGQRGFMKALSNRENVSGQIKELSLIRPFGAQRRYNQQLAHELFDALEYFPAVERLEVGVVNIMLDDLDNNRMPSMIGRLNRRGGQTSPIKRLGLVVNCSFEPGTPRFQAFIQDIAAYIDLLPELEFFEFGLVSRVDRSDLSKHPIESIARRELTRQVVDEVCDILDDHRRGHWNSRVWAQAMNNDGSRRHLIDPMVIQSSAVEDEINVFTHFDIHPFHYA